MSRPSQCIVCGCFEVCLEPNAIHCAERQEWKSAEQSLTEMERAHYDTDMH